jgi:hypothetical protein
LCLAALAPSFGRSGRGGVTSRLQQSPDDLRHTGTLRLHRPVSNRVRRRVVLLDRLRTLVDTLRRSVIMTVVLLPALAACSCGDRDDDAPQWNVDYVSDSREAQLTAVVATSKDEGWAVGMDADKDVIVLHQQGRGWKPADLPVELSHYKGADLSAAVLAASGPDNVWLFATLGAEEIGASRRRCPRLQVRASSWAGTTTRTPNSTPWKTSTPT